MVSLTSHSRMMPRYNRLSFWRIGAIGLCVVMLTPLIGLMALSVANTSDLWEHLLRTVIPYQIGITLALTVGVALVTAIIGTLTAWLTTFYQFPGRRILGWALILPLALPSYIGAYSYGDLLDYAGPIYPLWQSVFSALSYPQFKSLGGAIFLLGVVLYPYVYISARASFLQQSTGLIENARLLGLAPYQCFFRIALPMARPAILLGVLMAVMECLNDIGAVEYLGVQTLTMGVYTTWINRGSLPGAAQLSLLLLGFVIMLVLIEYSIRKTGTFQSARLRNRKIKAFALSPSRQILALMICLIPVIVGFIIPVGQLMARANWAEFSVQAGVTSLSLASAAALITTLSGLFLAYRRRSAIPEGKDYLARVSTLGYAIPGTVLAIGLLAISGVLSELSDGRLIIAGGLVGLILAYVIRFLALAFGTLDDGFDRLPRAFDYAARVLGRSRGGVFFSVHYALIRAPFMAAFILVFVDAMKELPATLILRPFGIETLATTVYGYASLEQIEHAAGPALVIIAIGLLPIILLLRMMERGR